ncbi:MAG: hypothetical protein ACUVQG_09375 [Thermogutta sp.]
MAASSKTSWGRRYFFDPDFCEKRCPICVRARRGVVWARWLQRIELLLTFGGCPWGRARQKHYGVPPNVPVVDRVQ